MLNVELDSKDRIAILQPQGSLSASDFVKASAAIDPCIAEKGSLRGLIISTQEFPGWESFGTLISHIKFIKNHQKKISKIAIVTDSIIGDFGEKVGNHFVSAEIKHYPFSQFDSARNWILSD